MQNPICATPNCELEGIEQTHPNQQYLCPVCGAIYDQPDQDPQNP